MRSRVEWILLGAACLVALAFLGSFFAGLGVGGPVADRAVLDPGTPVIAEPPASGRVRVEVLNGSGRSGLARAVTDRLREAGFDVVYFGNAAATADSSVVLARIEDASPARAVANHLVIGRVREEPDSTLLLDVTVILGRDWPAPDAR